jgi:hypothetical protein
MEGNGNDDKNEDTQEVESVSMDKVEDMEKTTSATEQKLESNSHQMNDNTR